MWRRVGVGRTHVSGERTALIFRVEGFRQLGTALAVGWQTDISLSRILSSLKMEAIHSSKTWSLARRTGCHIPNDFIHSYCHEHLEFYMLLLTAVGTLQNLNKERLPRSVTQYSTWLYGASVPLCGVLEYNVDTSTEPEDVHPICLHYSSEVSFVNSCRRANVSTLPASKRINRKKR
jgi:hypothetical protein